MGVVVRTGSILELPPYEVLLQSWPVLWRTLQPGLWYSLPFLGVLTVHEFGHYFTSRYYRIRATLPFFIPFPFGLGTFGAVIRIKDRIFSRKEFFDVGLAGPLAGFVAALAVLIYGLTHLPPLEYLYAIHPEYRLYGADYARYVYSPDQTGSTLLAQPLLFKWLASIFADSSRLPHANELMHYPVLVAGVLSLFFTALNLLPIGQLDGGHILYGLLGQRKAGRLSALFFIGFIFYAGLGLFSLQNSAQDWLYWSGPYFVYLLLAFWKALPTKRRVVMLALAVWAAQIVVATAWPALEGNPGWLVFGLLLGRVTGIYHPGAPDERPLSLGRKVLGWVMLLIFVLCFTPAPFSVQ
ncbi:site-2 protease family protein [Hymenobacter fodinae]|uniref:Site-2 protease family protein n=2 Tax=Hymenobacter fodinae TaxID=2510796 RepID=A0A4Z0PBI1_9BACT|nr:site-2 protease family protein [Hymenobacter fodinae]